jgi:trigger factor
MNITVEEVAACKKKLNIQIPVDEVEQEWKGALSEVRKYAQIPGFRVGRAPIPVLEKRFPKEIAAEVQRKLIPQAFREAVAKEKLKIVNLPSIEEVKFERNQPLSFKATVDVAPDFKLPTYKGLKIKKSSVDIKDEEIDEMLKLFADQEASFTDVADRGIQWGDFAVISYKGTCEGKPISEVAPSAGALSENHHFWLLVAKDSFVAGFCEPLLSAEPGEKKDTEVQFPGDFNIKELQGKKGSYSVEILGIKSKQVPELNDEFAKRHKAENLEGFKNQIRDRLKQRREHEVEGEIRKQLVDQLLQATPFELPESLVQQETRYTLSDIVQNNRRIGVSEDTLRNKSKEIFSAAEQNARDKVRASFIFAKIADEEKIKVNEDELYQYLAEEATRQRKSPQAFVKQLVESGEIDNHREQLLVRQALNWVVSNAVAE